MEMLDALTEQYFDAQTSKEEAFIQAVQKVQSAVKNMKVSAPRNGSPLCRKLPSITACQQTALKTLSRQTSRTLDNPASIFTRLSYPAPRV